MEAIIKIGIHFIHLKEKHNLRFIKIVPDRISPVRCQNNPLGENPFSNVPFCLCFLSDLAHSWYNLWRRARTKLLQLFLLPFTGEHLTNKTAKKVKDLLW